MTGWQPTAGVRFDGQEGRWLVLEWRPGDGEPEYRERQIEAKAVRLGEVEP